MSGARLSSLLDDYHLLTYDEVDSTNLEAKRLAASGGAHGAVIWARRQHQGYGRMGREWISQEGNLFVSLLLRPGKSPEQCTQLSFVMALASRQAVASILGDELHLQLKWPNDLLLEGRKLGGMLLEVVPAAEKDAGSAVIVGIGINVETHPDDLPYPAVSLKAAGVELISAKIVLSRLVHHLIQYYDRWEHEGFAPLRAEWLEHAYQKGERVSVVNGTGDVEGIFTGIDEVGRLQLQDEGGEMLIISAGDMLAQGQHAAGY